LNDYLLSVLLGIIEGLTEFLPISSTAHLRIAQALLNFDLADGYWKMYTIVIQLGAVLCLPIYFRRRIAQFLATVPRGEVRNGALLKHPFGLTAVAFLFTAIPAYLMANIIGQNLESLYIMGASLVIGGVVMWAVDARNAPSEAAGAGAPGSRIRTWNMDKTTVGQAIWIGACQTLSAVFPGVSRSMATVAAGQLAGMSRAAALEFSFFLSMPTMTAATGYDLVSSLLGEGNSAVGVSEIDAHGWIVLGIGFVVSFIVAYAAVAWFMAWVRRRGFVPFAVYRIIMGAAVLIWASS
jgi:undecaprenyl-diphosphatase